MRAQLDQGDERATALAWHPIEPWLVVGTASGDVQRVDPTR